MSKDFHTGIIVRGGARVASPGLTIVSNPVTTSGGTITNTSGNVTSNALPATSGSLVGTGDSNVVTKKMLDEYAFIKTNSTITHGNNTNNESMFGKILNVDNNSVYKFEGHILFTRLASSSFINFLFSVSGTPQMYYWRFETLATATSFNTQGSSSSNTSNITVTNVAGTQVTFSTHVSGYFVTPTTGTNTFSPLFSPGVASQPTIDVGSWLTVEKIGTYSSITNDVVGSWV